MLPAVMAELVSIDHRPGMPVTQGSREVAAFSDALDMPEYYLKRARGSMEAIQKMFSSLKFNNEQCDYLADKLKVVVQSGSSFLEVLMGRADERFSSDDITGLAEIFKLLVALGKQIESFVEGCCRDAWIQAAMTLTNVSQYVSSLGFNLELCRIAFRVDFGVSGCLLSSDEVADINKTEADIVEKKASADTKLLLEKVTQTLNSLYGEDRDLASYLLRKLMRFGPKPTFEDGTILSELFALFALVKPGAEQVGRGASATVYKAKWLGTWVAKKTFEGSENAEFEKEADILSRLCHPNITSMFCCARKKRNCSLIMELMDGDLDHLMERRCDGSADSDCAPFPILEAMDTMDQIGEGVKYLHSQGIVHRDLKSKNILYKKARNSENGYVHVKVTDFGVSKTRDKSNTNSDLTFNVGTNRWMPPEVMKLTEMGNQRSWFPKTEKAPKYPFKVDTYSFGMVCYEILTGHRPFHGNQNEKDIKRRVMKDGERPKIPDNCPPKLKALIEKCWSQKPTERPTFAEICGELKYLKYLLISESRMHLDALHKPESNEGNDNGPVVQTPAVEPPAEEPLQSVPSLPNHGSDHRISVSYESPPLYQRSDILLPPRGKQDTSNQSKSDDTGASLENAVLEVKSAVHHFANALISHMSKYPDELKHLKRRIRHELQEKVDSANHWKFLVQAFVCRRLFESFKTENGFFGIEDFVGLENTPLSSFNDFTKYKDKAATISELLAQKSADFSFLGKYCFKKLKSIIGNLARNRALPVYEEEWSMVERGRHPGSDFYRCFLNVAVSVWLLHRLVHSFEEEWSMLEWEVFPKGCKFQRKAMESVVPGYVKASADMDVNTVEVGFVVIPGFLMSKHLVKCEVYLRIKNIIDNLESASGVATLDVKPPNISGQFDRSFN
ncbi:hypothetical protein M758_6G088400 [Ceratodon purpureus]|nr:hypothetical protein M758_6G088400 [Ceratodon purpureus]